MKNELQRFGSSDVAIKRGVIRLRDAIQRDMSPREINFLLKERPGRASLIDTDKEVSIAGRD